MLLAMGNREDLIAGAKRCLIEKGYARTTARDIATASGVSLAAIGYHFGSKDALMNQAVYESVGDWADEIQRALTAEGAYDGDPLRRFESIMRRSIESFGGPDRGLWTAQLELMSLLDQSDELRTFLAGVQHDAVAGMAELFLGIDPAAEPGAGPAGRVGPARPVHRRAGEIVHGRQAAAAGRRPGRGTADHHRADARAMTGQPGRLVVTARSNQI